MTNAFPSIDPANYDTFLGAFKHILGKAMQNVHVALPAIVIAAERTPQPRATVRPLISMLTTTGAQEPRAQIASVPIAQIGGGGVFMSFKIDPGDEGIIFACDRDISNYLQSGVESRPNTIRTHDFADSYFLPAVLRGYTINEEDADNTVIQTLDGSLRLAFFPDRVKITGRLEVDGDITASGSITPDVPPI